MQSSSQFDGLVLDCLPPGESARPTAAVNIGWGEIVQALMVTPGVVIIDELGKTRFQLPR
jgi:hypothetical protein